MSVNKRRPETSVFQQTNWTNDDTVFQTNKLKFFEECDRNFDRNRQKTNLKHLQTEKQKYSKDIKKLRFEIRNLKNGRFFALDKFLNSYPKFDMKFRQMKPSEMIESLERENIQLKKSLDLMKCEITAKESQLVDVRNQLLAWTFASDRDAVLNYENERRIQSLLGRINTIAVKKSNMTAVIRNNEKIERILEAEQQSIDPLLDRLRADNIDQQKRIYELIRRGQNVHDFVQHQKNDFQTFQTALRQFHIKRDLNVQRAKSDTATIAQLIFELTKRPNLKTFSGAMQKNLNESLIENLTSLKSVANQLQNSIFASKLMEIGPRIDEQLQQKNKLMDTIKILHEKKDYFAKKRDHFEYRLNEVKNSLSTQIIQHQKWIRDLKREKAQIERRLHEQQQQMHTFGTVLTRVQTALDKLARILSMFRILERNSKYKSEKFAKRSKKFMNREMQIDWIKNRLEFLLSLPDLANLNESKANSYSKQFVIFLANRFHSGAKDQFKEKSLVFVFENNADTETTLDRTELKKRSEAIVAQKANELYD